MPPWLDDTLRKYDLALVTLEQSDSPTPHAVLEVIISRDRIQQVLQTDPVPPTTLLSLLQYDERLRFWAQGQMSGFDLQGWRSLVNPDSSAWWWFLDEDYPFEQPGTIGTYDQLITDLETHGWLPVPEPAAPEPTAADKNDSPSPHDSPPTADSITQLLAVNKTTPQDSEDSSLRLTRRVLGIYLIRDALQLQVHNNELSAGQLERLSQLDDRFNQQLDALSYQADRQSLSTTLGQLDKLRSVLKPPSEAWWWFSKVNVHWWDRLDVVWNSFTLIWLTASFSLLTDIVSRFLVGGTGIVGGFAVITQASLALIGGGSFTSRGQQLVERALESLNLPKHYWQEVRFLGATLLLLNFIGLRAALPFFARTYNNLAFADYMQGELSSAQIQYRRAIALNPNMREAHYNLGLLYEDLQNYEDARTQYSLAAEVGQIEAYNNLARLEILNDAPREALKLLLVDDVEAILEESNPDTATAQTLRYALLKNKGWALGELGFHQDAVQQLRQATELDPNRAVAYCLLAQNLETLDQPQAALSAWKNCSRYPDTLRNPEEFEWFYRAGQQIRASGE